MFPTKGLCVNMMVLVFFFCGFSIFCHLPLFFKIFFLVMRILRIYPFLKKIILLVYFLAVWVLIS